MDEKRTPAATTSSPGVGTSVESRRRLRTAGSTGVGLALAVASVATSAGAAHAEQSYTVRPGDTVSHIALRTGASVDAIVRANKLNQRAFIQIGQQLAIPTGAPATAAPAAAAPAAAVALAAHTVRSGDTLSAIAVKYATTVSAIAKANKLANPSYLRIGQQLTVPGGAAVQLVGNTFAGRTYPQATVDSANKNKAALLRVGVPSKADMKDLVGATARAMGVDPKLALAVAYQESGFDHSVVSPANAIGVMQVIPTSGQWASDLVGRQLNLLDPRDNVIAGVAILHRLLEVSPDLPTVVAAYYQGLTSVRTNGMFADTRVYVANVQTLMARFA